MSKPLSIDTAVNWKVSSEYKNNERYAVDISDSSNYIKMNSYQDIYKGKPYYATDYELYQNNELVLKVTDNRTGNENPGLNWA